MINLTKQQVAEGFYFGYTDVDLSDEEWNRLKDSFSNKQHISIEEAKKQLIGSVCSQIAGMKTPISVLHSSGVDSTFMLLMARKVFTNDQINVVRIGFDETDYDESRLSEKICSLLEIDGFTYKVIPDDALRTLKFIGREEIYKNWFYSSSLIPTAKAILYGNTVGESILTGDGGDELFCGYDRYLFSNYMPFSYCYPYDLSFIRRAFAGLIEDHAKTEKWMKVARYLYDGYEGLVSYWDITDLRNLTQIPILPNTIFDRRLTEVENTNLHILDKLMLLDIGTELFGVEKQKVETAARMAGSPSIISPFINLDTINRCASLPVSYKYRLDRGRKFLLRSIINDYFPEYKKLVSGKKKGFAVPIGKWFKNELKHLLYRNFSATHDLFRFLNREKVIQIQLEHTNGKRDHSQRLWSLLVWNVLNENKLVNVRE